MYKFYSSRLGAYIKLNDIAFCNQFDRVQILANFKIPKSVGRSDKINLSFQHT